MLWSGSCNETLCKDLGRECSSQKNEDASSAWIRLLLIISCRTFRNRLPLTTHLLLCRTTLSTALVGHRQEELELWWQLILAVEAIGKFDARNRLRTSLSSRTVTSKVKYFLRFLMIITKKGNLMPRVLLGSAGQVT